MQGVGPTATLVKMSPRTPQTGCLRHTPGAARLLTGLCGAASSAYHLRPMRLRRRFLMPAKIHTVAAVLLLGQAPGEMTLPDQSMNMALKPHQLFHQSRA